MTDAATESIDDIAARFWEDLLALQPTTATMYGDDRYSDRLEDPGPEGRAAMVALAQRAAAEAHAVPEAGLSVEERITRDMLGIVGSLITEENENHYYEIGSVDQINGPQTMLAQLSQFQPADTPERLDAWHRPPARVRAVHRRQHRDPPGRQALGRTAARIVTDGRSARSRASSRRRSTRP